MLVQGFKNLIKASAFLDESFQQLLKKSDQNRKSSKMSLEYIQTLHKFFQTFQASFQRLFFDVNQQIEAKRCNGNKQFVDIFQRAFSMQNSFGKKMSSSIKQTIEMSNNLFKNYSNLILSFQSTIRNYIKHQQILTDQGKRYFKVQKTMVQNIELYKTTFTDVKLIYNTDERVKRYITCESIYKTLNQQLKSIEDKLTLMNQLKNEVIQNYKNIQYEFVSAIKIIGNRIITIAEFFVFEYNVMLQKLSSYLQVSNLEIQQSKWSYSFSFEGFDNEELFNVEVNKEHCKRCPSFVVYFANIKLESYSQIGKLYLNYVKQIAQKIENRKKQTKNMFQFILNYFKQYQKIFQACLRDINSNYQKNRKKISQLYGTQHMQIIKAFFIIFQKNIQVEEVLNKCIINKIKSIENLAQEQIKIMEGYLKELKLLAEKFIKKKEIKKVVSLNKNIQNQQEVGIDCQSFRVQLKERSQIIQNVTDIFYTKMNQNQVQLNLHYNGIIKDFSNYFSELHLFCDNFHRQEFDQYHFIQKYQRFQAEVDQIMKSKIGFFADLSFGTLLLESNDNIVFQAELSKTDQFKKIKKPAQYERKNSESVKRKQSNDDRIYEAEKQTVSPSRSDQQALKHEKEKNEIINKYEQFLLSKIVYQEDERYVQSYKCGLNDKIILSGRLYITNHRLCFHSKFNPNNVFFGDTFLQIPKKDIIKVEKRQNAIIFNNSISITTINGQVFLTSFFSRNQAYDVICNALEINNNEDLMFQAELNTDNYAQIQLIQEDDLQQQAVSARCLDIDKILQNFDYTQIHSSQYTFPELTAYKFFKFFETESEIVFNRKAFKGFSMYLKQMMEHRSIIVGEWSPYLTSYLNSTNIKANTPLKFERTSKSTVPVANSGIPLMPKHTFLQQEASLYFYSKDKYVLETKIQNSGIPYSDYFNIRFKKVVETVGENRCKLTLFFYIQFLQKTMMKSVISAKSLQDSKATIGRYQNQMKKYLKNIQKVRRKQNGSSASENWQEKSNQLERQVQQSKQRQQKLALEVMESRRGRKRQRNLLLASAALNVLLLLILVSIC